MVTLNDPALPGVAHSMKTVEWNKPVQVLVGKTQLPSKGEFDYTSKDGRFLIEKRFFASSRNGCFNTVSYKFTDTKLNDSCDCDTLADAKEEAEAIIQDEKA